MQSEKFADGETHFLRFRISALQDLFRFHGPKHNGRCRQRDGQFLKRKWMRLEDPVHKGSIDHHQLKGHGDENRHHHRSV